MYQATIDLHPGGNKPWQVLGVVKLSRNGPEGVEQIPNRHGFVNVYFRLPKTCPCPCPDSMQPTDQWLRELALIAYCRSIQPVTKAITLTFPTCGQRVKFLGEVERGMEFCLNLKDKLGTVICVTEEEIYVKLDDHYEELDPWDNCIIYFCDSDIPNTSARPAHVIFDFDGDLEYVD